MSFTSTHPDTPRVALAEILRELRKRAGLTGDRLARKCGLSQSTISKIENGRKIPSLVDVESILRALGASTDTVREVIALAQVANAEWQSDRDLFRAGLHTAQTELARLEAIATQLRYFLPAMVTGLLATSEYVAASLADIPGDVTRTVAQKLTRQSVLYDTSKSFTFLLTEQALTWPIVPPPALAIQLERLASLSHLPNVTIALAVRETAPPRGPMNTFTVYDDRLTTVETFTGRMVYQDPKDIDEHLEIFARYEGTALVDDAARAWLAEQAASLRRVD